MTIRLPHSLCFRNFSGITSSSLPFEFFIFIFLIFIMLQLFFLSFAFLNIECKREVLHANVAASGHSLTALVWACH